MTITAAARKTLKSRKLTVNLPQTVVDKLVRLADRLELTQTQVVRESIEVRDRLQSEIDGGGTILIERRGGEHVKLWLTGSS